MTSCSIGRMMLATVLAVSTAPVGLVSFAWAQTEPISGTVTGNGSHIETLAPQKLRLLMPIRAEGTDSRGAIKALAQHKERVKKELLEMNAVEGSIQFGTPTLAKAVPGLPIEYSMRFNSGYTRQMLGRGGDAATEKLKMHVAISYVTVDWQLPTSNLDAISLLPESLQEQVAARDLQGKNNHVELDAATKEKVEELQAAFREQVGDYSGEEGPSIRITFVAEVTDAQRQAALQRAFEDARREAEELAKVAGRSLGELANVQSGSIPWEPFRSVDDFSQTDDGDALFQQAPAGRNRLVENELVGSRPEQLFLSSQVQVRYRLK